MHGTKLWEDVDCIVSSIYACMYIIDTMNTDAGACDVVSKDAFDCVDDFGADFVCVIMMMLLRI